MRPQSHSPAKLEPSVLVSRMKWYDIIETGSHITFPKRRSRASIRQDLPLRRKIHPVASVPNVEIMKCKVRKAQQLHRTCRPYGCPCDQRRPASIAPNGRPPYTHRKR
jgi:hypothetical protein